MRTYLSIKNYRCFVRPVSIEIAKGFTAFVGVNNAGKSTIMRFLLEFRPLLQALSSVNTVARMYLGPNAQGFQPFQVLDSQEIFSNLNNSAIEFTIKFVYEDGDEVLGNHKEEAYVFVIDRNLQATLLPSVDGQSIRGKGNIAVNNGVAQLDGRPISRLMTFCQTMSSLAGTLYIGPFRNTINAGTKTDYLDIQIGQSFITQFRDLKTGNVKKSNADVSRLTDDIRKVFQFDSLDIAATPDDLSLHLTVNGRPYKQHEVGSGLTHFVIVLANAAFKNPKWILIDEPELNLHPALQL